MLQQWQTDKDGRTQIMFADQRIDFNSDFFLYLTSKNPNPHFLPENQIKINLIDFSVTDDGLVDQMLSLVVGIEEPEVERQRDQNIVNLASFKKSIVEAE